MPTSSTSRGLAHKPRPLSARSFVSPPARSEAYPYTITRKNLKNKLEAVCTPELTALPKGLLLKTTRQKPFSGGSFSTIGGNSKTYVSSPSPSSKSIAATLPSRPISQTIKRHTVPAKTLNNVASITTRIPRPQEQVSQREELGPEDWTSIMAKVTESTPTPRMKIHRHRRAAILSENGTTTLFDPVESPQNQKSKCVSQGGRCDPSSSLSITDAEALSPHTPPPKMFIGDVSPNAAPKAQKTRPALSLPSRRLDRRVRAVSKSVTWDPVIVSVEPDVSSTFENISEENQKPMQNDGASKQSTSRKLDIEDCVETIKEWGKTDRSKLVSLINALKGLETVSEDLGRCVETTTSSNGYGGEVVITTVKSMNPRVPDFESSRKAEAKNTADRVGKSGKHLSVEINHSAFDEPGCNKENIPNVPLQLPAASRDDGVPRIKKRITVVDDYKSAGREVDSFAEWYAEMQLREFAKKYPLTGRRSSEVLQAANKSARVEKSSDGFRSVPGVSYEATKVHRDGVKGDGNVSGLRDIEKAARRGKIDAVAQTGRGDNAVRQEHPRPKRRYMPPMNDPLARKNAAIIQQRLEVLLLKEKERKAMKGLPEMAKMSLGGVDCSPMVGIVNPYYRGSNYEEISPMSASLWIPSERLKLKDA